MLAPMVPPAPGRFSTTAACPSCLPTWSITTRARMSLALPAPSGTITLMVRVGHSCADAGAKAYRTDKRAGISARSMDAPRVFRRNCPRVLEFHHRRDVARRSESLRRNRQHPALDGVRRTSLVVVPRKERHVAIGSGSGRGRQAEALASGQRIDLDDLAKWTLARKNSSRDVRTGRSVVYIDLRPRKEKAAARQRRQHRP